MWVGSRGIYGVFSNVFYKLLAKQSCSSSNPFSSIMKSGGAHYSAKNRIPPKEYRVWKKIPVAEGMRKVTVYFSRCRVKGMDSSWRMRRKKISFSAFQLFDSFAPLPPVFFCFLLVSSYRKLCIVLYWKIVGNCSRINWVPSKSYYRFARCWFWVLFVFSSLTYTPSSLSYSVPTVLRFVMHSSTNRWCENEFPQIVGLVYV